MPDEVGDGADDVLRQGTLAGIALVVWDMQEAIARSSPHFGGMLGPISRLLEAARQRLVPVIYTQHYTIPDPGNRLAAWWEAKSRVGGPYAPGSHAGEQCLPGTSAWRIVSEIEPNPGDLIIPKRTRSLFAGTGAADLLRAMRCETILFAGVAADRGILCSARESLVRGLFPMVITDAIGAFSDEGQAWAMEQLTREVCLRRSDEILAMWASTASDRLRP